MYNRYLPQGDYVPAEPAEETERGGSLSSLLSSLLGSRAEDGGRSGLLARLGLGGLDRGDTLLLLILFYLFRETGDEEWLIILALLLFTGP